MFILNRNRMFKKFYVFYDLVFIFDEIQVIEVDFLLFVEEVLRKFLKFFKCKIIFMIVIKLFIFEDVCEFVGFCDYLIFNRIKFVYYYSDLKVVEFVDFFLREVYEDEKLFLIVVNIIN